MAAALVDAAEESVGAQVSVIAAEDLARAAIRAVVLAGGVRLGHEGEGHVELHTLMELLSSNGRRAVLTAARLTAVEEGVLKPTASIFDAA